MKIMLFIILKGAYTKVRVFSIANKELCLNLVIIYMSMILTKWPNRIFCKGNFFVMSSNLNTFTSVAVRALDFQDTVPTKYTQNTSIKACLHQ